MRRNGSLGQTWQRFQACHARDARGTGLVGRAASKGPSHAAFRAVLAEVHARGRAGWMRCA